MLHHIRPAVLGLTSAALLAGVGVSGETARAAERITLKYGPFSRSVSVEDLRQYATTGEPSAEFKPLLNFVGKKQRASLDGLLKLKFPLDVVQMDKLLKSPFGDRLIAQVAKITKLPGGEETKALRSGLILSAASPEKFGVLSFLEKYPVSHVTVDLRAAQKLQDSLSSGGLGQLLQGAPSQ